MASCLELLLHRMVTRETSISAGLARMGLSAPDHVVRRLARLAELLENDAVDLGFLGPNEGQRVVSRHVLESAALTPHLIADGPIVDVGSGAGLPGLVLGALGHRTILIEAQAKRAAFLGRVADELGIDADVRHARAEDEGRGELRDTCASVVARALAAPAVAFELCLPLARPGGRILLPTSPPETSGRSPVTRSGPRVLKTMPGEAVSTDRRNRSRAGRADRSEAETRSAPPTAPDSVDARRHLPDDLATVADQLGGADVRWQELSVPGADGPRWVMMVDKRRPTPDRFPRRPGVPKRRPLGGGVASVH